MIDWSGGHNEDMPPNPASVDVMHQIDRMPAWRRLLVYEFGYVVVMQTSDHFRDARSQAQFLANWRAERQRDWLATDYILARKPRTRSRAEDLARKADRFFASLR